MLYRLDAPNAVMRANESNHNLVEYRNKLEGFVPKIALITELADRYINNHKYIRGIYVGHRALLKAIKLTEYCASHAARIYAQSLSSSIIKASVLRDRILDGSLSSPFTKRDVERKNWHGLTTKEDVIVAIKELIKYNWIAEESIKPPEQHNTKF
ncbi:MAG: hypothetical protein IPM94_08175 [bacterium]|nr:hypothetical protein [bacterium]